MRQIRKLGWIGEVVIVRYIEIEYTKAVEELMWLRIRIMVILK